MTAPLASWRGPVAAFFATTGLALVSLPMLGVSSASAADPVGTPAAGTVTLTCDMPTFERTFGYVAEVSVEGFRTEGSADLELVASFGDLPGTDDDGKALVPTFINVPDAEYVGAVRMTVAGTAVELTANGVTAVKGGEPIAVPDAQGKLTTPDVDGVPVVITGFDFEASGVGGTCSVTDGGDLSPLTAKLGAAPTPTPPPTSPPTTPPPSATPTKDPGGDKGKPASGSVAFDCMLMPFNSQFDYPAKVTVAGARAAEGDTEVELAASLDKMPGIAPVAIDGVGMRVEMDIEVDGVESTLKGENSLTLATYEAIPMPSLAGTVETDAVDAEVKVNDLRFDTDEVGGTTITGECTAAKVLGTMTIGVGELEEPEDVGDGGGDGGSDAGTTTPTTGSTLPQTGGGDSLPVMALWATGLTLLGAAALLLVPGVRRKVEA